MKKISYVLFCCIFLCGCMLPDKINKDTVLSEAKLVTESFFSVAQEKTESVAEEEINTENSRDYLQSAENFTDDVKADLMRKQQNLYYWPCGIHEVAFQEIQGRARRIHRLLPVFLHSWA